MRQVSLEFDFILKVSIEETFHNSKKKNGFILKVFFQETFSTIPQNSIYTIPKKMDLY